MPNDYGCMEGCQFQPSRVIARPRCDTCGGLAGNHMANHPHYCPTTINPVHFDRYADTTYNHNGRPDMPTYPLHARRDARLINPYEAPTSFTRAAHAMLLYPTPRVIQARYATAPASFDTFEVLTAHRHGTVTGYWLDSMGGRVTVEPTVVAWDAGDRLGNVWHMLDPIQPHEHDDDDDDDENLMFNPYSCDGCGDTFDYDVEGTHCEYCGEYRCDGCGSCYDCDDDSTCHPRVHDWSFKPDYEPKGSPGEPMMGLELEVGGRARDIVEVVDRFDPDDHHLYMKEDGSISGVEIVTHPMTLEYAQQFPFAQLLNGLRHNGSHVDDGYGLHVHVARNAFRTHGKRNATHQMTWLMFMYRNPEQLQKLARRTESRWAKFSKPMPGELVAKARRPYSDDRYIAVNCNNRATYELRFFRSTLNERELYAALEFADASVRYTRAIKTSDVLRGNALDWDQFLGWLQSDGGYPNLLAEASK